LNLKPWKRSSHLSPAYQYFIGIKAAESKKEGVQQKEFVILFYTGCIYIYILKTKKPGQKEPGFGGNIKRKLNTIEYGSTPYTIQ
jgi:hypothetical protein